MRKIETEPVTRFATIDQTIALIGMMGAGKSSIGKILATQLDWPFHDCDAEIESRAGISIPEIFSQSGESGFRSMEQTVLSDLLRMSPHVLATGGGIFLNPDNRALLKSRARTVWLDSSAKILWQRLRHHTASRPLLQSKNPRQTLSALLEERRPAYAEAEIRIKCDRLSKQGIVHAIIKALESCPPELEGPSP